MNTPDKILFLGDCNTLGTPEIEGHAYPDLIGDALSSPVDNCGHTMTTTREGSEYFERYFDESTRLICVQYGLVDSWLTFKHSPYVLYYPDSRLRKLGRKLTKKFKKWCKRFGLNKIFGTNNVVPLEEYVQRIESILKRGGSTPVILIETIPNKDESRNPEIRRYNQALHKLAQGKANCHVLSLYEDFEGEQQNLYCDPTHLSLQGHRYVADKLQQLIKTVL